jgi:hypothetical protein
MEGYMDVKETLREGANWIRVVEERLHWWDRVSMTISL